MQSANSSIRNLIRFHGLDFSHKPVVCSDCCWEGEAGSLLAPIANAAADGVIYACPDCHEDVGVHTGFSNQDIRAELNAIKTLIREVKALRYLPG